MTGVQTCALPIWSLSQVPGAGAATARLVCKNNGLGGNLFIGAYTMNAMKVGSVTYP